MQTFLSQLKCRDLLDVYLKASGLIDIKLKFMMLFLALDVILRIHFYCYSRRQGCQF